MSGPIFQKQIVDKAKGGAHPAAVCDLVHTDAALPDKASFVDDEFIAIKGVGRMQYPLGDGHNDQ